MDVTAPAGSTDLGPVALAAWKRAVEKIISDSLGSLARETTFLPESDDRTAETASVDWAGFPVRIAECLGWHASLEILDVQSETVGSGGRMLHEEYIEWRTAHSERGLELVELTTETSEYWELLAAHEPEKARALVADFAREDEVKWRDLYGDYDPLGEGATPVTRGRAFAAKTLRSGDSPYNNGSKAILCMVQPTNSLKALFRLLVAASTPRIVIDVLDQRRRWGTCDELAGELGGVAQLGRSSDPVLVERLARIAFEGRLVALDDAPLAIANVQNTRLRTPSGEPVPAAWFHLSRPHPDSPTQSPRYQRVRLEVPRDEGFCVGDLTDIATEDKIRHGGQIADLAQVALHLRVSQPGARTVDDARRLDAADPVEDPYSCGDVRAYAEGMLNPVRDDA